MSDHKLTVTVHHGNHYAENYAILNLTMATHDEIRDMIIGALRQIREESPGIGNYLSTNGLAVIAADLMTSTEPTALAEHGWARITLEEI